MATPLRVERLLAGGGLLATRRITEAPHTYGAMWRLAIALGLIGWLWAIAARWALSPC